MLDLMLGMYSSVLCVVLYTVSFVVLPSRALTHSKMDNYDSAIADCKKSIELDPNYSRAYLRLGYVLTHVRSSPV